jgi:hypothetical protein
MKVKFVFVIVMIVAFSCTTTKKVQTIQTAINKKDTTQTITISKEDKVDSLAIVKDLMQKALQHNIDFTTFYAKVKIDYESNEEGKNFTAFVYLKKDSVMYLRLVGSFLGITKEGITAKITKDSIIVVNKIDKVVQHRSIAYLQEVSQIPFNFSTLQNMFIGNPVFIDSNIVAYRDKEDKLDVLMLGQLFKNLLTLDKQTWRMLHIKLDDIDVLRSRTCDITYADYEATPFNFYFSKTRKIAVAEKSKLNLWLDFKQYVFNEPLTYVFNIPKNYKKQ